MSESRTNIPQEKTARNSNRLPRLGTAAVEAAVVLPLLVIVFVGVVESNRVIWAKTATTQAAYEGARLASQPGFSSEEVIQRCTDFLNDRNLNSNVVVTPNNISAASAGDEITVSVSVNNETGQISIVRTSDYSVTSSLVVLKE
ncbi:MAG: TadE/TadG family type IV pilus assembly protein [Planctomycetota bacterium]